MGVLAQKTSLQSYPCLKTVRDAETKDKGLSTNTNFILWTKILIAQEL